MRDIGSRNTTGPQAVLCAAVSWWLSGFRLDRIVEIAVDGTPASELWAKDPLALGAALSPRIPWDRVNQHFWDSAARVPAVRHMVEFAVRSWKPGNGQRVLAAKTFVASVLMREAGEIALSLPALESMSAEIEEARRARRRRK